MDRGGWSASTVHLEGDRCLTAVAQCLREAVREGDFVARYGGEEFAVLLTSGGDNKATQVAKRLQQSVRQLHFPHPGLSNGAVVTISAGFATSRPVAGDHAADLIQLADEALYRAKKQGRDRVVFAGQFNDDSSAIAPVAKMAGR
ncbi:MAG: GGDEF domain-containing protein [Lysobacterales bacterium]